MKHYPAITNIILGAIRRSGYTAKDFAKTIGMPYNTMLYRFNNPGSWKLYELGALQRHAKLSPEELVMIERYSQKGDFK